MKKNECFTDTELEVAAKCFNVPIVIFGKANRTSKIVNLKPKGSIQGTLTRPNSPKRVKNKAQVMMI